MQKFLLSFALLLLFISKICADELSEGYKSFINNDINQANQHFKTASQVEETKAEAYLMLSLLATINKENDTAFNYFLNFYNNSKNPDPYTMAMFYHNSVMGFDYLKTKAQINWLEGIIKRPDLNTKLKASVFEELGKYYEAIHDIKKSREYLSRIGAVMDWQIAGDFENISASGFDKEYQPINHPEPEAVFKNKLNADVKWFDLSNQIHGKWIDFTYNFLCENSLIYAQTFCNSPSDQLVFLRIGTSGSLKLWINDQLIFKEEEERNNEIDTYVVPVKISKGNNRILLQIGCSKIDRCNFMMRVTNKEGELVENIPFSVKYEPYIKTVQDIPTAITSFEEEYLLGQIREHPDKLVNYLILTNDYLLNDKIHEAMDVILKAQKFAPNCSFILNQLCELYIRDKKKTSVSLTQEKLKSIDPDNPNVLNYMINFAFSSNNIKDARKYTEKKEQLYKENEDLLYYKMKLASSENKPEEYEALVNKSYSKYPYHYDFVNIKFQFEKNNKKNKKGGVEVLKKYTKQFFNAEALKVLYDEYLESGQVYQCIDILKMLIGYHPFNDDYYRELGLLYLQLGNNILAKHYLEACLKIAPYFGTYHGNYAKVLLKTGEPDKALIEYKLNIEYKPDDYQAIKKLRSLQAKKEVFDYFDSKDYYKLFDDSPNASDYPSDNIISLADEKQVVLYENGGCEERQILMCKALTIKGIDNLKEYRIGYSSNEELSIEKAEVLKKNGNRLRAEINGNQIVYTSLEPGDGIFLIYKKSKKISDQMSKQFYEKWFLNNWIPELKVEYNLLIAKNVKFDFKTERLNIEPDITGKDDFMLYSWKAKSDKPIRLESYMPGLIDVCGVISISTVPDWNYISKWYYDISNAKTKTDREVIETVNDLLKGKEKISQFQKAQIFYNFIEQNIHYSYVPFRQNGTVPQKASDVLITRIGDCKDLTVLFTSMCKAVGIKAGIVLVMLRNNGINWMTLPSFNFDHAISKVILDGNVYYIELTSNYLPFAALGEQDLKAVVLDAGNDTANNVIPKILSPDTRKPNNIYRELRVSFKGDSLISSLSCKRTGVLAASMRFNYRDLGKDEQDKKFTKTISRTYSNTKLLSLNFDSTLKSCSDTLTYNYSSIAPKVFTYLTGLSIVKLPLSDKIEPKDFLSLEDRKFPVEAWEYNGGDTLTERVIISFPENKKLVEVPKSVHYSCNQADYMLTFNVKGKNLVVNRTMIYKLDEVPVSDYPAYRSFIESVVNSDSQQIGFN